MDTKFYVPQPEDELKIPKPGESTATDGLPMIPDVDREDAIFIFNDVISSAEAPESYTELGKLLMAAKHLDQVDPSDYHLYPADIQQVMLPAIQKQIEFLFLLRHQHDRTNLANE